MARECNSKTIIVIDLDWCLHVSCRQLQRWHRTRGHIAPIGSEEVAQMGRFRRLM